MMRACDLQVGSYGEHVPLLVACMHAHRHPQTKICCAILNNIELNILECISCMRGCVGDDARNVNAKDVN